MVKGNIMKILVFASVLALCGGTTHAATLGSLNFQNSAFADAILTTGGTLHTYDPSSDFDPITANAAGIGPDISSGIYCVASCTFDALFTDNTVLNGIGADLAIFEGGGNESLAITINGIMRTLDLAADVEEPGFLDLQGFQVGYWLVDLTDFGVAAGAQISSISFDLLFGDRGRTGPYASADFTAVGALNSAAVPLSPSLAFSVAALGGLAFLRKRR
jgi:hypothetical protein